MALVPFTVTVARRIAIKQGLLSPVRAAAGMPPLVLPDSAGLSFDVLIGIRFDDADLTDRGWYLDTDTVTQDLDREATRLEAAPWTEIFTFRPTMELVCRHLFQQLQRHIDRLGYVELNDVELGVTTRYAPRID